MKKYCAATHQTIRRPTREVKVGSVGIGGNNPIRIQSMTTSSTRDIEATVEQIVKLHEVGCEIVRVTVQGIKEADACEGIKNSLIKLGIDIPLVADIHFYPPAALRVADFVDKVRVNPGNFVDKRASFKVIDYDDASYELELLKIEEKFTPLVEKCKKLKRAIRIGTNHGSLSDRIMNRYGDTPYGMVESALEFARVCRKNDFHDIIFSMKASNPQVMILAYRLLASKMDELGWDYPLHLGVTEAGQGEDGRIKSAMGIGSLLLDGLGDTIRVSLTEDAWKEIDPCQRLKNFAHLYQETSYPLFNETTRNFETISKPNSLFPKNFSMHKEGSVILSVSPEQFTNPNFYEKIGCDRILGEPKLKVSTADILSLSDAPLNEVKALQDAGIGILSESSSLEVGSPLISLLEAARRVKVEKFAAQKDLSAFGVEVKCEDSESWDILKDIKPAFIALSPSKNKLHASRKFFDWMNLNDLKTPVILSFEYDVSPEDLVIHASAEMGSLLCDGLGDGIWIKGPYDLDTLRNLSFGLLQAARRRLFKTDFISCPSCGRTLFDLQDVTKRIQQRTSHLPGVKIAIMGCIVNGPGEMADADFGYVGSKAGMIDLYVGKECVEKDIDFADADDRLVELIKRYDRWQDPAPNPLQLC